MPMTSASRVGELAQRVVQRAGLVARPVVQVRELDAVPRAPGLHRPPQRLVVGVVVDRMTSLAADSRSAQRAQPVDDHHRRRAAVAPGGGVVRPARRQVRAPGQLAGLQVGRAELRAAQDGQPRRRPRSSAWSTRTTRSSPGSCVAARPRSPIRGSASSKLSEDYRDWTQARYYRRLYYSYKYFFAVSQPSRNEHDGAIFAGTDGADPAGPRSTNSAAGTSGASPRMPNSPCDCCGTGWSGLHVDQSWGRGIMPLTFEALKGQRYRWCFGGIQLLRMHWRSMMPCGWQGRNHLSAGQRWATWPAPRSGTETCSACSSSSCWPARPTWPPAAAGCSASSRCSWSPPCR